MFPYLLMAPFFGLTLVAFCIAIALACNVKLISVTIPATTSEKGQGMVEFALILVIVAVIAAAIMAVVAAIYFRAQILTWGSTLVAIISGGGPTAIFVAAFVLIILAVIFGRRS